MQFCAIFCLSSCTDNDLQIWQIIHVAVANINENEELLRDRPTSKLSNQLFCGQLRDDILKMEKLSKLSAIAYDDEHNDGSFLTFDGIGVTGIFFSNPNFSTFLSFINLLIIIYHLPTIEKKPRYFHSGRCETDKCMVTSLYE